MPKARLTRSGKATGISRSALSPFTAGAAGGGGGGGHLLHDTFTDSNGTNLTAHTMNTGPGWTALAGSFTVQSNKAEGAAGAVYVADAGDADAILTCDVTFASGTNAQLLFRVQDVNNWWGHAYVVAANYHYLVEFNGSYNYRASGDMGSVSGTTKTATVTLSGTSITVNVNGFTLNYTSISMQTETKFGFREGVASPNTAIFDNFIVDAN